MYGETGRYPLIIKSMIAALKYYYRLQNLSDTSLVRKAFKEMSLERVKFSWFKNMNTFIKKYQLENSSSTNKAVAMFKNNIISKFAEFWKNKLYDDKNSENGNKMRTYRKFKTSFGKEEYLKCLPFNLVFSMSKLRLSAHKLHIETGRYVSKQDRLKPQERLCAQCNLKECEDEIHFIMKCPLYSEERASLLNKIYFHYEFVKEYNIEETFCWLMSNIDTNIIQIFAVYIKQCFSKRNSNIS